MSKRDKAMFKQIAFLANDAKLKCCFSKLENLGANLDKYGYKKIKYRQSKTALHNLKKLDVLCLTKPHPRSPYRIKLNVDGVYLYCMLSNRINYPNNEKPPLEYQKTAPRIYEKPPHLDLDQIKRNNHPIKILPSTTSDGCNYTNTKVEFNSKIESMLNGVSTKTREQISFEFHEAQKNKRIVDKEAYMEVIARRIITSNEEIEHLQRLDREKSFRMQESVRLRFEKDEAVAEYTPSEKIRIIKQFREGIKSFNVQSVPKRS